MNEAPLAVPRRVIPRWRDFRTTLETGELDTPSRIRPVAVTSEPSFYVEKLERWRRTGSIEAAIDVVESALVGGNTDDVQDAAKLILANGGDLPEAVVHVAERAVGNRTIQQFQLFGQTALARQRVHKLRAATKIYPRNVFLWVDIARAYCVLGQKQQARAAIEKALKINNTDRFVLRSATRLFVHINDPELALMVLQRSPRTRHDPWLLASEIATTTFAGRKQQFMKAAREHLRSDNLSPFDKSELASAVGTTALHDGHMAAGQKLLRQSLIAPTDNSVAQAEWVNSSLSAIAIDPTAYAVRFSYEARTRSAVRAGEWREALNHCENWRLDEPFSVMPPAAGSYYASVALEDFVASEAFARAGLESNPGNPLLLNNLSAALACQGRTDAAVETIARIPPSERTGGMEAIVLATEGLIRMRQHQLEAGRARYAEAIARARANGQQRELALAWLHLAREELPYSKDRVAAALGEARAARLSDSASMALSSAIEHAMKKPVEQRVADAVLKHLT